MTIAIIVITSIISFLAFNNNNLLNKLQFSPYQIKHRKQWYRILTYGFVHADWQHLIFNMFVLFFFGTNLEHYFAQVYGTWATLNFILLYLGAIVASTVYDMYKYKDDFTYKAIGASGATSAVLFASIFFNPWQKVYIFGIVGIYGIVFALLYLAYSYYMSKKNNDNIGHNAHFYGAIFGFLYPLSTKPELIKYFIDKLINF